MEEVEFSSAEQKKKKKGKKKGEERNRKESTLLDSSYFGNLLEFDGFIYRLYSGLRRRISSHGKTGN